MLLWEGVECTLPPVHAICGPIDVEPFEPVCLLPLLFVCRSHDGFTEQADGILAANPGSNYASQQTVFNDLGQGVLDNAFQGTSAQKTSWEARVMTLPCQKRLANNIVLIAAEKLCQPQVAFPGRYVLMHARAWRFLLLHHYL